jgi:hypothetical protein
MHESSNSRDLDDTVRGLGGLCRVLWVIHVLESSKRSCTRGVMERGSTSEVKNEEVGVSLPVRQDQLTCDAM